MIITKPAFSPLTAIPHKHYNLSRILFFNYRISDRTKPFYHSSLLNLFFLFMQGYSVNCIKKSTTRVLFLNRIITLRFVPSFVYRQDGFELSAIHYKIIALTNHLLFILLLLLQFLPQLQLFPFLQRFQQLLLPLLK